MNHRGGKEGAYPSGWREGGDGDGKTAIHLTLIK